MQHPDYDIEFKPAIARYDWDQTYDVLEFVHLPQGFSELMEMVGIPCYELMAIDRYTPYDYLWAEQYSDYVYNFLVHFNFSPYSSSASAFVFSGDTYSKTAEYPISLSSGKYKLTCLINQGGQEGVIGGITTLNQAHYAFTLDDSTTVNINKIINHLCTENYPLYIDDEWGTVNNTNSQFCANSIVLSQLNGSQWQPVAVSSPNNFLFYSDISNYFSSVSNSLKNHYTHIQEYLKGYLSEASINRFDITQEEIPVYQPFPSYFKNFCYLQRANNNKWGGNLLLDLGVMFAPKIGSSLSFDAVSILINQGAIPLPFASQYKQMVNNTFYSAVLNTDTSFSFYGEWEFYSDGLYTLTLTTDNFTYAGAGNGLYYQYQGISSKTLSNSVSNTGSGNIYPVNSIGSADREGSPYNVKHISYSPLLSYFSYGKSVEYEKIEYIQIITRRTEEPTATLNAKTIFDLDVYSTTGKYINYLTSSSIINEAETLLTTWSNYHTASGEHAPTGESIPSYPFDKTIELTINLYSESEWLELYNYGSITDTEYLDYLLTTKAQLEEYMVDSVRLKEIHACLGAGEYAYSAPDTPAYMHMARRLDDVAKAIGLSFNLDGSIMSIRQSKHLEQGSVIPVGWSLGQFGHNNGASTDPNAQKGGLAHEERLGLVYEVKGNRFGINQANGEEEVIEGGYVLCENLPQYLHIMLQDLDRSLGLQQLGSFAVSNPNYNPNYTGNDESIKSKYYKYNGLGESWLDTLYLLADTNRHAAQANVGSLKAQAISQEVLGALGVAVHEKIISMQVGDSAKTIKYPGFNGNAQTVTDLLLWALMNIALLNEN